jgi:hypothetical protein
MQFSGVTMTGGLQLVSEGAAPPSGDPDWANVSLLMNTTSTNAQTNNTFLDGSTSNFTITRTGTPTQGSFTPFTVAGGSSYSTATNGGSGYFPGSSYLTAPSSTNFAFGTGDFTMECWVRFSSIGGGITPLMQSDSGLSSTSDKIWLGVNNNVLTLGQHSTPNAATTAWTPSTNTWYHVAAVRQSGTVKLFIDGVQKSVTNSTIFNSTSFGQNGFAVGVVSTPVYLTGYMSSVRVVKGTAVYTASFTPSTTPLTAISGTSLLLNYTNAGMYDAATKNNMLSTGTAQASTTQAKWSPTSLKLAGGTDALTIPSSSNFNFGSGDFTIEAWIYVSAYVSSSAIISKGVNGPFLIFIGASSEITFYSSTNGSTWAISDLRFATNPATGTWHYIAVTRSGTTVRTFFNGVLANSTTLTGAVVSNATDVSVGRYSSSFNGYIQDLRLTKGVARYTANFTPPTAALPTNA